MTFQRNDLANSDDEHVNDGDALRPRSLKRVGGDQVPAHRRVQYHHRLVDVWVRPGLFSMSPGKNAPTSSGHQKMPKGVACTPSASKPCVRR